MGGVVVFFEPEALPVYGLVDLHELPPRGGDFGLVVIVDRVEGVHELVMEEAEPVGAEEAAGEEVARSGGDQWRRVTA
jgi:hypothetical protein